MDAIDFLRMIYHAAKEQYTYIWSRTNENQRKRTNSFRINEIEMLLKVAERLSEDELNISYSMGLLDYPLGSYERAKSADITGIPCIWCDIDIESEMHGQNQKLAKNIEMAHSFLPNEIPASIIVDSGYGIHAYWVLNEILSTREVEGQRRAKRILGGMQSVIRYRAGDCYIDPTADLSRMLRLPGTLNWKNKENPRKCQVIETTGELYRVEELEEILAELSQKMIPKTDNPRVISESQRKFLETRENERKMLAKSEEKAQNLFENCAFCRYCRDHISELNHAEFVDFFPNLLRAADGRDIALNLCKKRFKERFDLYKSQQQIESFESMTPITCERISKLHSSCNPASCIVLKAGKKSPSAILLSSIVKDAIEGDIIGKIFPNAPDVIRNLKIPSGFTVSNGHVSDTRGRYEKTIINSPVVISREFVAVDSNVPMYYELMHYYRGVWQTCLVRPVAISDSKTLTQTLPMYGIRVSGKFAGLASEYLNTFIEANESKLPQCKVYSRLGWHGNEFILPTLNDGRYRIDDPQANDNIKVAGNRNVTLNLLRKINRYPYARLLVDANFAPPLLQLINCRNFIIDLICPSHLGKTTALQFANSMWGRPQWMVNFNATINAASEFGTHRNSLPTNVNEWQMIQKKDREEIANQIIHRFSEGEGRSRCDKNGNPIPTKSWNGILITTSEQALTSENTFQGVKTRCLEIRSKIIIGTIDRLGQENLDHELCKEIQDAVKSNYGHFGAEFIQKLQEEISNDLNFKKIREEATEYYQIVMEFCDNKIISSYADYIVVIAMAHYRCNKWFLYMSDVDNKAETIRFIKFFAKDLPTRESMLDSERAKTALIDWVLSYKYHFIPWVKDSTPTDFNLSRPVMPYTIRDPIYGFWIQNELYGYKNSISEALKMLGFDAKKILAEWKNRGDIESEADRVTVRRVDPDGNRVPVVSLKFVSVAIENLDSANGDGQSSEDESTYEKYLPF